MAVAEKIRTLHEESWPAIATNLAHIEDFCLAKLALQLTTPIVERKTRLFPTARHIVQKMVDASPIDIPHHLRIKGVYKPGELIALLTYVQNACKGYDALLQSKFTTAALYIRMLDQMIEKGQELSYAQKYFRVAWALLDEEDPDKLAGFDPSNSSLILNAIKDKPEHALYRSEVEKAFGLFKAGSPQSVLSIVRGMEMMKFHFFVRAIPNQITVAAGLRNKIGLIDYNDDLFTSDVAQLFKPFQTSEAIQMYIDTELGVNKGVKTKLQDAQVATYQLVGDVNTRHLPPVWDEQMLVAIAGNIKGSYKVEYPFTDKYIGDITEVTPLLFDQADPTGFKTFPIEIPDPTRYPSMVLHEDEPSDIESINFDIFYRTGSIIKRQPIKVPLALALTQRATVMYKPIGIEALPINNVTLRELVHPITDRVLCNLKLNADTERLNRRVLDWQIGHDVLRALGCQVLTPKEKLHYVMSDLGLVTKFDKVSKDMAL
jgi:hypothetical protein